MTRLPRTIALRALDCPPLRTRRQGFTLIEVIGALLLTAMVMAAAVASYVNLSNASNRAAALMRGRLHAITVLDRVSRDVRAANLVVKPAEVDPLSHPWFFVADSRHDFGGADRIRLITRSHMPRVTAYHASDLAEVAYFTREEDDGSLTLLRWSSPSLPERYNEDYPQEDDPATWVVAEGLRSFSLRFLQEGGEWTTSWDSTQIVESSQLPFAVEIKLSMWDDGENRDDAFAEEDEEVFAREVVLPLRPLDLEAMVEEKAEKELAGAAGGVGGLLGGGDTEGGETGRTPAECAQIQAQVCTQFPIACDAAGNVQPEFASTEAQLRAEYGCPQ